MSAEALPTDFPLVDQGYDPGRVDEYLATQMLQLRTEVDQARAHIADLENELSLAKEAEEALKMTMVVAKRASDEMIATAKAEAKEIVGEARREAFALMTEARTDADSSIGEGKEIIAAAREEALQIVNDVETETARLIAERNAALHKLHTEYEAESAALIDRINTLRSIASDLEAKSAPPPAPAPPAPPPQPEAAAPPATSPDQPSSAIEGGTAVESQAGRVSTNDQDGDAPNAAKIRESFSGRRSAKLPRIGEEAGRSALAAATAMRAHLTHEPDDSGNDGDDDLAVRTA